MENLWKITKRDRLYWKKKFAGLEGEVLADAIRERKERERRGFELNNLALRVQTNPVTGHSKWKAGSGPLSHLAELRHTDEEMEATENFGSIDVSAPRQQARDPESGVKVTEYVLYQEGQLIVVFSDETYWIARLLETVVETVTLLPPTTRGRHKNRRRRTVSINSKDGKFLGSYFELKESAGFVYIEGSNSKIHWDNIMDGVNFKIDVQDRKEGGLVSQFAISEEQHTGLLELWNTTFKERKRREERGVEAPPENDDEESAGDIDSSDDEDSVYSSSSDEEMPEVRVLVNHFLLRRSRKCTAVESSDPNDHFCMQVDRLSAATAVSRDELGAIGRTGRNTVRRNYATMAGRRGGRGGGRGGAAGGGRKKSRRGGRR